MKSDAYEGWGWPRRSAGFVPSVSDEPESGEWAKALPFPEHDANKYSRGKLVLIAGSKRYPGAAILAARAAQRMGAGYVQVVTDDEVVPLVVSAAPSLVVVPLSQWNADAPIETAEGKPCAVCMGPGFDAGDAKSLELVYSTLDSAACPVLVDGGALTALGQTRAIRFLERRSSRGHATVLTPHGGEAARIAQGLGIDVENCADASEVAQCIAEATWGIVALKGPDTVVADAERSVVVDEGTPALAKAGTGDVLAGMASALLAQGLDAWTAVELAVHLHARAGSAAARLMTEICVTPEDVIDFIPAAIRGAVVPESGTIGFA